MLAPGFAMRASSFNLSSTECNLTQYLASRGYDVWLFDYRAGIDLSSARSRFTVDDVAREDWPTAVAEVRRETGKKFVDVVGHCMGSTTALMAKARGLEGIRSIVCSQNTLDLHMLPFSRLKAKSGIADLLQGFGLTRLEFLENHRMLGMAFDMFYRLNPLLEVGERCSSPWCRWAFMYFGPTHCHDRLNEETHRALRYEFGEASLDAMAHIAEMAKARQAVDAESGKPYLDSDGVGARNLRIPILFLAGERNRIFLPSGARTTYRRLCEANPDMQAQYEFQLLKRYGHLDCIIGRNAHLDVFPFILKFLEKQRAPGSSGSQTEHAPARV
jgi:cholesterol oxidase